MNLLVAGGAGFLGSNLCEQLLNMGHKVVAVDNLITGSKKNIDYLLQFKNFTFVNHDIIEFRTFDVDGIFNLACPASPPLYQKDPVGTVKTNVIGSTNLLELARKTNSRILQASTSEIYGDPKISPQTEEYWGNVNPIGLRSCYDEGKRTAETLFMDFHRQYGTDIRIARIFNTYGPRMRLNDGRVLPAFIGQAIRGEDLTVFGDGSQTRSFCYVDDLVEGIYRLLLSDYALPVNIGNPDEVSILDFAHEILALVNNPAAFIDYQPLPQDDPKVRQPNIALAKKLLDWEPKMNRKDGLKATYEYFKEVVNPI